MIQSICVLLLISIAGMFVRVSGQAPETGFASVEDIIESFSEDADEEADISSWLEELQLLSENRINVNSASREELLRIPFLNEFIAGNIIEYRNRYGPFMSVYELAAVEGVGRELGARLAWFVVAGPESGMKTRISPFRGNGKHMILAKGWQTFPKSAGYLPRNEKPPAFLGGPQKAYMRWQYSEGSAVQAGITGDKDPGEEFLKGTNPYGFDFYSAHLKLGVSKWLPQLIVGDYTVRAGQGLVISQGFGMGKTADVMQVSKPPGQVRPYTSSGENHFFRGTAASFQFDHYRIHLFYSRKRSDANLVFHDDGSVTFTSLQNSGYHRTLSETEDKNSLRHTVTGAIFSHTTGNLRTGIQILYEEFQYPFIRNTQLYQKFLFQGRENYNASADYRFVSGRHQFYGEAAVSRSGALAILQGAEARLHDQLNMALLFRHFERNYHATWAGTFGENSSAINETGLYTGIKLLPAPGVSVTGYADWFRFPWMRYTTAGPSSGHDYLVQTNLRVNKNVYGYLRLKNKVNAVKTKDEKHYFDETGSRTSLRGHVRYHLTKTLFFTTRIEKSWYSKEGTESGILVYQDAGWTPVKPSLSASLRFSVFSTESYNSRIYVYENDLLYNFSTLAFSGEGFRTYLNLRYRFSNKMDFWLKIGYTAYSDRDIIGSGHGMIQGNARSESKIQIRYRL